MHPVGVIGTVGLLATVAAWPLCAQQPTALDSAVAGCYALTWASDSNRHAPAPDTIALTLLPAQWPPQYFGVRADAGWEGRNGPYSTIHFYWGHRADTVFVSMTNGFSGVGLLALPTATGLRGIARYGSDNVAEPLRLWWKVEARRTACLGFR
jgi:hypothetical protein